MLDNQNRMLAQQQEMLKQQIEQLEVNRQALEEAKRANRRDKVQDIASIGTTIYVGTKIWDHIKKNM
jgi:prefoldin subunit 5